MNLIIGLCTAILIVIMVLLIVLAQEVQETRKNTLIGLREINDTIRRAHPKLFAKEEHDACRVCREVQEGNGGIGMVEYNFKSQRATTIEQSERLIALGLRKETADMTHHYLNSIDSYELKDIEFSRVMHLQELVNKKPVLGKSGDDLYAKDIPAWSLHRLIEILDTNPFVFYLNCGYDNVIDHVEEYIRSGIIDTRYLEEWCLNEE